MSTNEALGVEDHRDALWRGFPKTLLEFEERFATEEACREYLIACRWNGAPACAKCGSDNVWQIHGGLRFECAERGCRHQTSVTSGTLFHGTRKPLRLWFRAIWEICVHRHGISAKDLQRILGFGSYETAWTWAHRIRRALVRPEREKLAGCTELDETYLGGKHLENACVLVGVEEHGRARLIHAPGNHEPVIKHAVKSEIADDAKVKTDGHAAYNEKTLGPREQEAKVQTPAERRRCDHLQLCHWTASGLKRWLRGTHHGAVSSKHLQSYLDEHVFRYNRRKTNGIGRLVARCLENMVQVSRLTRDALVSETHECRAYQGVAY